MGTVFAAFILSADRIPKEFGLLLAVAILTDALIVRMTLVPAFLTLLGEKSWYIPGWLDRALPNITIEPPHGRGTGGRGTPAARPGSCTSRPSAEPEERIARSPRRNRRDRTPRAAPRGPRSWSCRTRGGLPSRSEEDGRAR